MRQSITTKYIGPTDTRGSRVKAKSASGHTLTRDWLDSLTPDENHATTAFQLARKLGWHGTWQAGSIPTGCVFVLLDGDTFEV